MITASFTNHSGTYGSWQTWIPPVGGCQNHVALSIPHLANGTSVGSSVTFTSHRVVLFFRAQLISMVVQHTLHH